VDEQSRPTLAVASTQATLAAIGGYVPGFFIPLAVAWIFGATGSTDAFFLAFSVASLTANAFSVTTQQAAIPFLVTAEGDDRHMGRFAGEMSTLLLFLATVPVVVLNVAMLAYVRYRAHWSAGEQALLQACLWAFLPYIALSIVAGVYSGVLNAQHSYVRVALSPAVRSAVVLGILVAFRGLGVYALIIGYIAGEGLRLAYLLAPILRRLRVKLLAWPHRERMFDFSRTAVAQIFGSGVLAFLALLDRTMASRLAAGSLSLLDYADRLWQVPLGFLMSGFMVTSLSHWSERLYRGGGVPRLSRDTARAAAAAFGLLVPPAMLFVFIARPLIAAVFGTSKFTAGNLQILAQLLTVLAVATPIYVSGLVYTRAFLVLKRSDWLLGIALVQLATKVVLNVVLIDRLGVVGLAISTALTYTVSSVLLVALFHFRLAPRLTTAPSVL